jgi:hypothetical protein
MIDSSKVETLVGKLPGLGGGVSFELVHGEGQLEGQFLGSKNGIENAIAAARDGSDSSQR